MVSCWKPKDQQYINNAQFWPVGIQKKIKLKIDILNKGIHLLTC